MPGHHPSPSGRQLQNRATTGGYRIALVLITAMQLKHAPEQGRFAVTDQLSRFQRGALIERAVSHRPKPGRHARPSSLPKGLRREIVPYDSGCASPQANKNHPTCPSTPHRHPEGHLCRRRPARSAGVLRQRPLLVVHGTPNRNTPLGRQLAHQTGQDRVGLFPAYTNRSRGIDFSCAILASYQSSERASLCEVFRLIV